MLCLQQRGSVSIRSARASAGDKLGSGSHHRKKLAVGVKTLWVNRESGVQYQPSTLSGCPPRQGECQKRTHQEEGPCVGNKFNHCDCLKCKMSPKSTPNIWLAHTPIPCCTSFATVHLAHVGCPAHKHLGPLNFSGKKLMLFARPLI